MSGCTIRPKGKVSYTDTTHDPKDWEGIESLDRLREALVLEAEEQAVISTQIDEAELRNLWDAIVEESLK